MFRKVYHTITSALLCEIRSVSQFGGTKYLIEENFRLGKVTKFQKKYVTFPRRSFNMLKISLLTLLDLNVAHCKTVITKSFYEQCLLYNINLLIFYCIYYWTLIVDITFRVLESAYAKNLFYFLLGHHFPSSFQHVERETECKKPGCKV